MTDREKLIDILSKDPCVGNWFDYCYQCKYYGDENCYAPRMADHLLENGVVVLEAVAGKTFVLPPYKKAVAKDKDVPSKWISVEDRLPTEPMEYVVTIKGAANATTMLFDGALWFEEDPEGWRTYYAVSHWMPLPEPPE